MAYFSGEYECTVDTKGRMLLPSRVKVRLPENFNSALVIQKSTDPCLMIYTIPEWEKIAEKVSSLNEFDENTAMVQRNFLRGNTEVDLDNLGRFLISKRMLEHAGITKEAILVGLGNRLEIWNPEIYDAYLIKDPKQLAEMLQKQLGTKIQQA
jgi:MraZ protein